MAKSKPEEVVDDSSSDSSVDVVKKRKRKSSVPSDEELEIDINLPEPPSKKAKREALKKEKRGKKTETDKPDSSPKPDTTDSNTTPKRSDYGIWIGNLPWTATKESLRTFLREQGGIAESDMVRVHMPPPAQDKNDRRPNKPQNKGFAYVDFTTKAVLETALELTETLMGGRKVLIKNAKSFEGRPDKPKGEEGQAVRANGKPPAKRVFVGNLDFAITQDDLREHFGQAGEVEDVFLATFEDSGKCKGYGWIRFAELEAAEAAVRGFVLKKQDGEEAEGEVESEKEEQEETKGGEKKKSKAKKPRKWFINRMHGRELRCEFAEDSAVRYNKRFGKQKEHQQSDEDFESARPRGGRPQQGQRRDRPARKVDARSIAPAKALSNAPRASSAIVAGAGKKLTFEE